MKLRIRYENELQTIELNAEDTEKLWICLSLEGEGLSQEERESMIQETWDESFNRKEYNNWHAETRHIGRSKAKPGKDEEEEDIDYSEPLMSEVRDDRIFLRDELEREKKAEYEETCALIRRVLTKKPDWAEAFIAVHIDGESIRGYSSRIGVDENNITQKIKRAKKKLREYFINRQI